MAREMVRQRVVRIMLVLGTGLTLVGLLLLLAAQPHQAYAKTDSVGALRQTGTGDANITGTTSMNTTDMEAMGHAMSHLIMAFDTLHEMQQQHLLNSSMLGDRGSTAGTADTTGTAGMGMMVSSADTGALIEMMGHLAESIGYLPEALGTTGALDTGDPMGGAQSDLSQMLDILDQMIQATTSQVPTLSGIPGVTETGTTTETTSTEAISTTTSTMGTGAMTGSFDPSPLLPAMIQTLQVMSAQLHDMTGATAVGGTGATTATAGMGADTMALETPTLRQNLQALGQSMELLGHMHMLLATVTSDNDTAGATAGTGGDMLGLINAMAQAMSDHITTLPGLASSDMRTTGATATMTDTTNMTDTTDMTGTTGSDSMGRDSVNPMFSSVAQLIQITLLQIQGMTGGMGDTISP